MSAIIARCAIGFAAALVVLGGSACTPNFKTVDPSLDWGGSAPGAGSADPAAQPYALRQRDLNQKQATAAR